MLPFEHTPASAQASSHCPPGPESAGRLQCYRSGCVAIGPVCVLLFCQSCILCRCHSPAPNSAQPVFQACLHLTSWLWGLCPSFKPCCQAQPAEALDPVTCPKHDFPGVRAGVLLSGRFACRALEKGLLHHSLPSLHQANSPGFPTWAALFMCQMAPAHLPLPPTLQCLFVHPLCHSVQ